MTELKTIKELEAEINHLSMIQRGKETYNKSIRIQALKDVLKLIMDDESIPDLVKTTLKSKIQG